jgi:aspartyl-tRNA(Asn)/glutamyl-tRNA(Gln) amidotransferase subunit A
MAKLKLLRFYKMTQRMITITEIKDKLAGGASVLDVVEEATQKLEAAADFNTSILPLFTEAKERAKELDNLKPEEKAKLKLFGVPFIAKDNYLIKDTLTSAGSKMLQDFKAPYSATVIKKLEDEGAVCIAKANLDAFAHGSSTENSDFGVTKNPHDETRVPGGSSGGSAAVVALGIVPFALGSDTGGSIRLPASFCGVYGIKPSYGLVSRYGVVAMISSTDCMGPLASCSEDARLVLSLIAGKDPKDSTTIESNLQSEAEVGVKPSEDITGTKVAVIKEFMADGVDPEVKESILAAVNRLKKSGVEVEEISIPEV